MRNGIEAMITDITATTAEAEDYTGAVSYTHLDVYKRQTLPPMLMYGRVAQSKTKTASPATIPKSGERNRKIHS